MRLHRFEEELLEFGRLLLVEDDDVDDEEERR